MKKVQPDSAAQLQTDPVYFVLAEHLIWRAKKYAKGSTFTVSGKLSKDDNHKVELWLKKEWMRLATDEDLAAPPPSPVAATSTNPPPTLELNPESADGTFVLLDPRIIAPGPNNPRKEFADEPLQQLVASVRVIGVRTPIQVRATPPGAWEVRRGSGAEGNFYLHDTRRGITMFSPALMRLDFPMQEEALAALPKYEIIAGERRWRAARLAESATIRAIIETQEEGEAAEWQTLENLQRTDLQPLEEAAALRYLLTRPNYSIGRLEQITGLRRNTLYGKLKMLEAPEAAQEAAKGGKLVPSVLEHIGRQEETIREEATQRILDIRKNSYHYGDEDLKKKPATYKEAEKIVEDIKKERQQKELREKAVADAKAKGMVPLDEQESRAIVHYSGSVNPSCGYVGATEKCPRDPNGRTWQQAMKDQPAKVYAAIEWIHNDRRFKTTALYKREEVNPVLKKLGLWNAEGSKVSKEREKKDREKEVAGRKHEAMQTAIDELQERAISDGPGGAIQVLRPLMEAFIAACPEAAFFVAKRRGIISADQDTYDGRNKARRMVSKLVGAAAAKEDCGLAVELAIAGLSGNHADAESSYYKQGIQKLADALGVPDPVFMNNGQEQESADVCTTP